MGWDSIGDARWTLGEALNVHKLLLEGDAPLDEHKARQIALEVREKLIYTQDIMTNAYSERAELYNEIRNLSASLEARANLIKHMDGYYLADSTGAPSGDPYCLLCWEKDRFLLHLIRKNKETNCCPSCDREYLTDSTPFNVKQGSWP